MTPGRGWSGLVLAGLLVWAAPVGAEGQWRRSDALGADLGPGAAGAPGWALLVEPRPGGSLQTLYHEGQIDGVRLVDTDAAGRVTRVVDRRGQVTLWQVDYDPATGLPRVETAYENDQVVEVATLEFRSRVLVARRVEDGQGQWLYTDRLSHWPDGSLRRLERDGPEGPRAEVAWSYGPDGEVVAVWEAEGELRAAGRHREWSSEGGKTRVAIVAGLEVVEARVTELLAAGAQKETLTVAGQVTAVRTLDPQGRVTEEIATPKGGSPITRRWTYDDRGRTLEQTIEGNGPREVWTTSYPDDRTVVTLQSRGGLSVRQETLVDGGRTEVRYWDRGRLFLIETWADGRRTGETYLKGPRASGTPP